MGRGPDPGVLGRWRGDEALLAGRVSAAVPCSFDAVAAHGSTRRATTAITGEIARVIRRINRPGPPDELEVIDHRRRAVRHGALCARSGVPLAALLAAYESSFGQLQVALWSDAHVGDDARLSRLTERGARWLSSVCEAASDGYACAVARSASAVVRTLAEVLVLGYRSPVLEQLARLRVQPGYRAVVGIAPEGSRPWGEAGFDRTLMDAVPVLHCVLDGDLVLLEPVGGGPAVDAVLRHPRAAAVHWGAVARVPVGRLPGAVRQARATAELGYAAELPTATPIRPEDVLVEALSMRTPAVRARLDDLGERLGSEPELLRTVEILYRTDLNRGRAAELLGIARRTLNLRLNRVEALVGVGPTTSAGIRTLALTLAARRLAPVASRPRTVPA